MNPIRAGDQVLLWTRDGARRLVLVPEDTARVPGLGVLRGADFIGKPWGDSVDLGGTHYLLLRPNANDPIQLLERGAQIITPKDAARIVYECGLKAGARVAEAGVGSGALTLALARAVAPTGHVHAYDLREDHLRQARKNLETAGLSSLVELLVGDATHGFPERDLDALVLDLPEPERCIPHVPESLAPSGILAVYTPLVVQMERAVHAAREHGFLDVRALELLERAWVVHDRGSRPDTTMLGHTGFLVFARRP